MQSHSVDVSSTKEEDLSHDKDVSVKEKEESSLSGASPKADEVNELLTGGLSPKVKEEMNELAESSSPSDLENTAAKTSGVCSSVEEDHNVQIIEDPDDLIYGNGCNQLVVYDPQVNGVLQNEPVSGDNAFYQTPLFNNAPKPPSRVLPSVGAFTVQCANCFKWRLIPTKEKYEEIRESILQFPFVCEVAREWRPSISCDDPADISQDGSRLWAIDKPNIALPPPGWERLLRIRGEGSTKFADVYYQAPTGKKLRSMVDVQKFLLEHPEYIRAGVTMSQFSFQIPRPLQENYVRKKRPARLESELPMPGSVEPTQASPLSWINPETQTGGLGESDPAYFESPILNRTPPRKKRATGSPSKHMYNGSSSNSPSPMYVKVEDPTPSRDNSFDI